MALFKGKKQKETAQEKSPKEEKPKKESQFKGLSIGKILWSGFLVIAIIILLSGYSSYLLYAERIDDNHDDQQSAIAERAVAIFAARLDAQNLQIKRILNEERVQQALNELPMGEITPPAALKNRLSKQLPKLIRQVIISSDTSPNDQLQPPLSYACLELPALKQPVMELHRFGTADKHIDIAFPIGNVANNRSLLLSFDIALAHQWLNTIDSGGSYIELQQQIDDHPPLTFGQAGNHQRATSTTHTIPGTQFQIAVTLPQIEELDQIERILFFVNFGVVIILIALTLWGTLVTVRVVLNKDLRTLGSLLKRSSVSLHHILPIKLAELRGCAEEIKRQLGIIDENKAKQPEADAPQEQENEIPPLFQPDIMVDVEPADPEESQSNDEAK